MRKLLALFVWSILVFGSSVWIGKEKALAQNQCFDHSGENTGEWAWGACDSGLCGNLGGDVCESDFCDDNSCDPPHHSYISYCVLMEYCFVFPGCRGNACS